MGTFTLKGLAPYSSTVRREIVIDASHLQEKTKVRQSKQATLNINGSAVAQQRSITHSSALQSGEITVENSDWPTICSLSFDSSALSWPQWASVFVFMLPYSFFFSLTGWIPYSGSFWQANTDTLQPGKFSGKCVTCYNRPRGEGIKSGKGSAVSQFGIEIYYMSVLL